MYIQNNFQEILGILYPNGGYGTQGLNIIDWANATIEKPDVEVLITRLNNTGSAEYKKVIAHKTAEFQAQSQDVFNGFFDSLMPQNLQKLYEKQQSDVEHWLLAGGDVKALPRSVVREWEIDKSQRLNAEGWIPVSAIIRFRCHNALDLFNTWRMNTEFVTWLREEGKPLRSYTDAMIAGFVPTDDDMLAEWVANAESLLAKLKRDLASLPEQYVANILPGKIEVFGIKPV